MAKIALLERFIYKHQLVFIGFGYSVLLIIGISDISPTD